MGNPSTIPPPPPGFSPTAAPPPPPPGFSPTAAPPPPPAGFSPTATPPPPPPGFSPTDSKPSSGWIDEENSAPGDVHFKNPLVEFGSQALQGVGSSALEVPATIGNVLHRIGGTLIGNSDPITDALNKAANMHRDSIASKGGALLENMAEWIVGEGELKALTQSQRMAKLAPVVKMLEAFPKISEAVISHPEVVKYLPDALRQGIMGASQTAVHGGSAGESAEAGIEASILGTAGSMALEGGGKFLRNLQGKVAPTTLDIGGVPVTQLASEARGPNGEIIASKAAQKAAQYGSEPALQAERQAGFKQLQTNLAKTGVENVLNDANNAASASAPGVAPNIRRTAEGWRYIPPDGSAALTVDETRATLNELKQHWLDKDWSPAQEQQIRQTYNDMQNQLDRYDALNTKPLPPGVAGPAAPRLAPGAEGPTGPAAGFTQNATPFEPHHVDSLVTNTNSYADAASHLRQIANQQLAEVSPELRQQYQALDQRRIKLQDDFSAARDEPNKREEIMRNIDDLNDRMEGLLTKTGLPDSPDAVAAPLKMMRSAAAFEKLQNVMDQHFNLRADTAERIGEARKATKLKSLSDHIEQVRSQYGDVLNPVIGQDGLDHIIKLGTMLDQPTLKAAPKTYLENVASVLRKHFAGGRGALAGGGAVYLAHALGSLAGGTAGGLGVLGTEAGYRMMVNRMATDPAFAETMIQAIKNKAPVGKVVNSFLMTDPMRAQIQAGKDEAAEKAEDANAGSE